MAEALRELFDEDPTHRYLDDRKLHRNLLFRHLIPEETTLATVKAARETLP